MYKIITSVNYLGLILVLCQKQVRIKKIKLLMLKNRIVFGSNTYWFKQNNYK